MTSQFGDFCFICKGDFSWQMDFFTHVWAFWGEMQWTQETLAIMAFFEVGSAQMSLGANCLIDGIPARDIHSYLERDPKRDGVDDNNSGLNGRYHQRSHKYREMPGESGNKMRYGDTRWQTGLFLLCYCMSIHQMTRDLLFLTHRYKSEVLTSKFSSGTHWILKQNLWLDAFFSPSYDRNVAATKRNEKRFLSLFSVWTSNLRCPTWQVGRSFSWSKKWWSVLQS